MNEINKNVWASLANLFVTSSVELRVLSSSSLPEADETSIYAVDLAMASSGLLNFENFYLKGHSRLRENKKWNSLRPVISFAFSLAQLTLLSGNATILSPENAAYVSRQLNFLLPDLGSLLLTTGEQQIPDSYSPSWVLARSIRLMDHAISISGMSYKQGNELERMTTLMAEFAEVFRRLQYVANTSHSSSLQGDLISPLRPKSPLMNSESRSIANPPPSRPSNTRNESTEDARPLVSFSQRSSYEEWVTYCKEIGKLQRMPERLFLDLIPPKEVADHLTKSIDVWEEFLEERIPGRRNWLSEEGVTKEDFSGYWSQPAWVLEFIEKLMDRNLQLEYQAHLELGESEEFSQLSALAFVPRFSTSPPEDDSLPFRALPFELFERIRHHLASVDSEQFQAEMISNDCFFVNDYVRRRIKSGLL